MRLENGEVLFRWPLEKHQITAGMYYRGNDNTYKQWHGAIDLRAAVGTPVYAAEAGTVDWVQRWNGSTKGNQSYGNAVRIRHADYNGRSLRTLYAHLQSVSVTNGEKVAEGQLIGYAGNTGSSAGSHLHFEVRWGDVRRNPLVWLDNNFTSASGYTPYTYGAGEHSVVRPAADKPSEPTRDTRLQNYTITPGSRESALEIAGLAYDLGLPQNYTASSGDATALWAKTLAGGGTYKSEYVEGNNG